MRIKEKHYDTLYHKGKLPRKIKKNLLGLKISKSELKRLLKYTIIINHKNPKAATIWPYEYCPWCGCQGTISSGNKTSYPELWVDQFCIRCGAVVGWADNSPFYHVLEKMIPEDRHINCPDDCPCKTDSGIDPEEVYWNKIVPDQFRKMAGIRLAK